MTPFMYIYTCRLTLLVPPLLVFDPIPLRVPNERPLQNSLMFVTTTSFLTFRPHHSLLRFLNRSRSGTPRTNLQSEIRHLPPLGNFFKIVSPLPYVTPLYQFKGISFQETTYVPSIRTPPTRSVFLWSV